jgi:UDP-N-acetylmuramoyl-L-alanyl-D-glutamate--2,6-diaminopimelate ligase
MVDGGVRAVAMEVSSHALAQHRVSGVRFECSVFTNLSQDHLDFHADMEEYFLAKAMLFQPESSVRGAVGVDDEWGRRLAREATVPITTFGFSEAADLRAEGASADAEGVSLTIEGRAIRSPLRGLFNVSNCLGAFAAARAIGIADDVAAEGIRSLPGVPGRVEPVNEGQDFLVMVDYAHTPDSIDSVLRAARPLASGRLIVVFGCGGDRDHGQRPLMGRAATAIADLTVITSDNPRSEDPLAIIADIEPGAKDGGGAYVVEPDRRSAIRLAVREGRSGDVVVIAGKGHEPYQELAGRSITFDDRVVAAEELRAVGGTS